MEERKMGGKKKHIADIDFFENLTGDISTPEQPETEAIGVLVKTIREAKGLTLEQLSNLTGFDEELLSNIEEDKIQPAGNGDQAFKSAGQRLWPDRFRGGRQTLFHHPER
jgi:hypothetical protein